MSKLSSSSRSHKHRSRPHPVAPANPDMPEWVNQLSAVCGHLYRWFCFLGGLIVVALLILLILGVTAMPLLGSFLTLMTVMMSLGVLAWAVSAYDSRTPGWGGLAIGFAFFLFQFLGGLFGGMLGHSLDTPLATDTLKAFTNTGTIVIAQTAILMAVQYLLLHLGAITLRQKASKFRYISGDASADTRQRSFIPKCWQMSRCRVGVRSSCPNYIDHIPCWKRRSGCFCDRTLANYLVSSSGRGEADEAIDMQIRVSKTTDPKGTGTQKPPQRTWKEQRALCHECPLFLEHQEYKYKNLSWISFPATVGIVAACFGLFDSLYRLLTSFLTQSLTGVTAANIAMVLRPAETETALTGSFEYVLLGVLSLLLLGYIIALTELALLKWKL